MSSIISEKEHNYILQTYKRLPIEIDHASGIEITDKEGNIYYDFLGGIAVNVLGHSYPKIISAVKKQIKRYMHVSNYLYQDAQIQFAEKLSKISGYPKVFLSNSGTESNEGAIKLARRWGFDKGKTEIIAFSGGFHGRTFGALSLMDKPIYKDKMGPFLDNMKVIKYNGTEELVNNVTDRTCAILLEFVQGEGGIATAKKEWIDVIKQLQEEYGFLIIADEIQAGTGRTGDFFSFTRYDIKPDIVTLAKGIGGGLPLGCILVSEELSSVFDKGMHGTTFGGNPVACAAGEVIIDELNDGMLQHVRAQGEYFHTCLLGVQNDYPDKVVEVRGYGLMLGLLLTFEASSLVEELLKRNFITNAASGLVLRLVPPFIVSKENIDNFIIKLRNSLDVL